MYPLPAYTLLSVRFHQHLRNENQFLEPRSPRSYRQAEERLRQREVWVRDQLCLQLTVFIILLESFILSLPFPATNVQ